MTINLSKDVESSINAAVQSGRFPSVDDAVTAAWLAFNRQPSRGQGQPSQTATLDELHRQMLVDGLLSQLPDTANDLDDEEDEPVTIEGEPLSETIIRESGVEVIAYFLDSSAIVKRYVQETGTAWVRRLTRRGKPEPIYLARITAVEVTSAVARRRQGGSLPAPRVSSILSRFRSHLADRYTVLEITPGLLTTAMQLANTHSLRAYDAVQLAAALEVNQRWLNAGLATITLISADRELNNAATAEGLAVDDPNSH